MFDYLGEHIVPNLMDTPYANFSKTDWAMKYIECYSSTDGEHHKQWVLDQVARILKGTKVIVSLAQWKDGTKEYRFNTSENTSQEYKDWAKEMLGEYNELDEEYEYSYDEGIAP